MGSYSTTACFEVADSFQENFDVLSGITFSVDLQVAAANRYALAGDILFTPRYYPKFTGFNINPIAVALRPLPGAYNPTATGQEITYSNDCIATVTYSTNVYDQYVDSIEPYIDYVPLDHRQFRWDNTNSLRQLSEAEAPQIINRGCNFVRTLYKQAAVPTDAINLVGCVNNASYTNTLLGFTFPAETLLYQPQGITRTISTLTSSGWTVTLKFAYNPNGWNTYWRASTGTYQSLYFGYSGTRYIQYPLANFSALLF